MSSGDARWRRVYSREWHERGFQDLSDAERVVYFYMRTGPQSTSNGMYRLSTAVAVEDIGNVTAAEFESRRDVVCQAFGWRFDPSVLVLWIPTWFNENPPQSANVCHSWRKLLGNVPNCDLKFEAQATLSRQLKGMPEGFRKQLGSLPDDLLKREAQPKTQPRADQGVPIRDQGSGEQGAGALRAGNCGKPDPKVIKKAGQRVMRIARKVMREARSGETDDYLIDVLQEECRREGGIPPLTRKVAFNVLCAAGSSK